MKNLIIAIVVIIILAVGGWWLFSTTQLPEMPDGGAAGTVLEGSPESGSFDDTAGMPLPNTNTPEMSVIKEFTVNGSNFSFTPKTMAVKKGDTVRVTFINESGTHDWVLDEFNARTQVIGAGKQETVEFVADKAGTFEYYCSVGQHRTMGMKGTLTVTE
jgi:nitrosocyanin